MVFNAVITLLRQWCFDKARAISKSGGDEYAGCGYPAVCELEFKASMLTDRSFENADALKDEILRLIDVHYDFSLLRLQDPQAKRGIDKINREFCAYLDELLSGEGDLSPAKLPYQRVIVGPEAASIKENFRSVWKYESSSYWYPLTGDEPEEVKDRFFVTIDRFEPYCKQVEGLIDLPQTHIYRYGESLYQLDYCIETAELIGYEGNESIYTDKVFSWAIYFSHENTVSFAGSIVPKMRELLIKEKPYWNRFEWEEGKE